MWNYRFIINYKVVYLNLLQVHKFFFIVTLSYLHTCLLKAAWSHYAYNKLQTSSKIKNRGTTTLLCADCFVAQRATHRICGAKCGLQAFLFHHSAPCLLPGTITSFTSFCRENSDSKFQVVAYCFEDPERDSLRKLKYSYFPPDIMSLFDIYNFRQPYLESQFEDWKGSHSLLKIRSPLRALRTG